ncbi:MAG: pilus motility taxis protein HmpF [Pleurocapsa sp.]
MARVLYLAEIQKQNKGFMGGVETKLKLLACQRNDQSWSIVQGNELITSEEAGDFGDGALVIVQLGVNRQLQGKPESASQRIVGILKGFSRLLEKNKEQEQEIAQWKESLTIQSEELSRREIEMETRLEQLEQMEEEFKEFDQQRQEINQAKAEAEKIKAEFEAKSLELEGAWEQLQGQQQRLQEQIQQSKVLDDAQAEQLKKHIAALSLAVTSTSSIEDKFHLAFEALNAQQELINSHWQKLEQYSQNVQSQDQELSECREKLNVNQQELDALISSILEIEEKLQLEQKSLAVKQELAELLTIQENAQTNVLRMFAGFDGELSEQGGQKLDIQALENMPLPNLEKVVDNLQKDLEKVARFVSDQEEELGWQCQAVEELEAKVAQASEFERLTLEQELADEKEAKKMLDQTLVGQRRSLKERHDVLLQHSRILKRRQGIIDLDDFQDIEIEPIKQSLKEQQEETVKQKQETEQKISQLEQIIIQLQENIQQKTTRKKELLLLIEQDQENYQKLDVELAKIHSTIDFYQEYLQPLQDSLDNIRQNLSEMENAIASYKENDPQQAVGEIERMIGELTASNI